MKSESSSWGSDESEEKPHYSCPKPGLYPNDSTGSLYDPDRFCEGPDWEDTEDGREAIAAVLADVARQQSLNKLK